MRGVMALLTCTWCEPSDTCSCCTPSSQAYSLTRWTRTGRSRCGAQADSCQHSPAESCTHSTWECLRLVDGTAKDKSTCSRTDNTRCTLECLSLVDGTSKQIHTCIWTDNTRNTWELLSLADGAAKHKFRSSRTHNTHTAPGNIFPGGWDSKTQIHM